MRKNGGIEFLGEVGFGFWGLFWKMTILDTREEKMTLDLKDGAHRGSGLGRKKFGRYSCCLLLWAELCSPTQSLYQSPSPSVPEHVTISEERPLKS